MLRWGTGDPGEANRPVSSDRTINYISKYMSDMILARQLGEAPGYTPDRKEKPQSLPLPPKK